MERIIHPVILTEDDIRLLKTHNIEGSFFPAQVVVLGYQYCYRCEALGFISINSLSAHHGIFTSNNSRSVYFSDSKAESFNYNP